MSVAISGLSAAAAPVASDQYPVNQGGTTKRLTALQVAAVAASAGWAAVPSQSTLTWVNQGGAAAADTASGFSITAPASALVAVRAKVATPPATPWTLTARVGVVCNSTGNAEAGLCLRATGSGRMYIFGLQPDGSLAIYRLTDFSTYSSTPAYTAFIARNTDGIWLRVGDDGANVTFEVSPDGETWLTMLSETRATWLTPNQAGAFVDVQNSSPAVLAVSGWKFG